MLRDLLPRYTHRFAIPTAQPGLAYRQTDKGFRLDQACCFKYLRTVGPDNMVRFGKHRLQILLASGRPSYARAGVEVHERLDGNIAVYYQGQCLAKQAGTEGVTFSQNKWDDIFTGQQQHLYSLCIHSAPSKRDSLFQAEPDAVKLFLGSSGSLRHLRYGLFGRDTFFV